MGNWEFQMLQRLLLSIDKHVGSKTTSLGETNDFDVPEHHSVPLLHTKSFWNFIVNIASMCCFCITRRFFGCHFEIMFVEQVATAKIGEKKFPNHIQ